MSSWLLAWRNLLRNRRRSIATLLAISIGATSILLFGGYSRYVVLGIQTEFIGRVGHLQIQRQGYFKYGSGSPEAYGIVNYKDIISKVKSDPVLSPMITVVTPILHFGGIAGNFDAGLSRMVQGTGLVADESAKLKKWNDYNFPERDDYLASLAGSSTDAVIVGKGVARMLQLCGLLPAQECAEYTPPVARRNQAAAGDASLPEDIVALAGSGAGATDGDALKNRIEILASNAYGAPNVVRAHVVRAQDQGIKELDDITIQTHLAHAQKLVYGRDKAGVTSIIVQLSHTDQLPQAQARLNELAKTSLKDDGVEVLDFATLNPLYTQSLNMLGSMFGFVTILIVSIVLFTIGNTMSMAVVERTVEIGTLRAIGLRGKGIQRIFVCEGIVLGLVGAAVGVAAALGIAHLINQSGWTYVPPGRASPVPLEVWILGDNKLIASVVIGLIMTSVASAWMPSRRAAKMNIMNALRHV
jgi:putative ABC transport system permease protein